MGNVTLPTPVFVAGGVLCLLAGFLVGAVAGPDRPVRTTATVDSYRPATNRLCLTGDGVKGQEGVGDDGRLCGVWRRANGATLPAKGDRFRFASLVSDSSEDDDRGPITVIVGDVVG